MEDPEKRGNVRPYPRGASFGILLDWHLNFGTRPNGHPDHPGKRWGNKEFASAVGGVSERTVRNWRTGRNRPVEIVSIERALFGDTAAYDQWRLGLRAAFDLTPIPDVGRVRSPLAHFLEGQVSLADVAKAPSTAVSGSHFSAANIQFSDASKDDLASIRLSQKSVQQYLVDEARRHPNIFDSSFSSVPFAMKDYLLIVSFDRGKNWGLLRVDRVLTRMEAYPVNAAWATALSHYRRASALSYRRAGGIPIPINIEAVIREYRDLVKALVLYFDQFQVAYGFGCNTQILLDMLEEAILYADSEMEGRFIHTIEVILSHAHKMLLDYVPTVRLIATIKPAPEYEYPLADAPALRRRAAVISDQDSGVVKRILLVEDDASIGSFTSRFLRRELGKNFDIIFVTSGDQALREIVGSTFDLLISDVVIPGVDGKELAKATRKASPNTKIILVSGYGLLADTHDYRQICDSFLPRPFNPKTLVVEIKKALGLIEQ